MDGGRKIYGNAKMKIKIALLRNLNPAPVVKTKLTQFGKNRQHFFWMSEASQHLRNVYKKGLELRALKKSFAFISKLFYIPLVPEVLMLPNRN